MKFHGRSQSISKLLLSYPSCSSCKGQARLRPSRHTTLLRLARIALYTFQIGFIGMCFLRSPWVYSCLLLVLSTSHLIRLSPFHNTKSTARLPHRYATEPIGIDPIAFLAGLVQTALYLDFFYIYFTRCVSVQEFLGHLSTSVYRCALTSSLPGIGYCKGRNSNYPHEYFSKATHPSLNVPLWIVKWLCTSFNANAMSTLRCISPRYCVCRPVPCRVDAFTRSLCAF